MQRKASRRVLQTLILRCERTCEAHTGSLPITGPAKVMRKYTVRLSNGEKSDTIQHFVRPGREVEAAIGKRPV